MRKYRTLAVLRARRDEVDAAGGVWPEGEGPQRRAAFRRLSQEFPGALRELELPVSLLVAKERAAAEELASAEGGAPIARLWIRVTVDYHDLLADALAAKMWLARRIGPRGSIGEDDLAALAAWRGRRVPREEAEALHHPPGGRVVELVWRALEERYGLERDRLRELVVGFVDARA